MMKNFAGVRQKNLQDLWLPWLCPESEYECFSAGASALAVSRNSSMKAMNEDEREKDT